MEKSPEMMLAPIISVPAGINVPIQGASIISGLFSIHTAGMRVDPSSGVYIVTPIDPVSELQGALNGDCGAGLVACGGVAPAPAAGSVQATPGSPPVLGPLLDLEVSAGRTYACSTGGSTFFANKPPVFGSLFGGNMGLSSSGLYLPTVELCVNPDTSLDLTVRSALPAAVGAMLNVPAVGIQGYMADPSSVSMQSYWGVKDAAVTTYIEPLVGTLTFNSANTAVTGGSGYMKRLYDFFFSAFAQGTTLQASYVDAYRAIRTEAVTIYPSLNGVLAASRRLAAAPGEVVELDDAEELEFLRLLAIAEGGAEAPAAARGNLKGSEVQPRRLPVVPSTTRSTTPSFTKTPRAVVSQTPTGSNKPASLTTFLQRATAAYSKVQDFVVIMKAITTYRNTFFPAAGFEVSNAILSFEHTPGPDELDAYLAFDFDFWTQSDSFNISLDVPMTPSSVGDAVVSHLSSWLNRMFIAPSTGLQRLLRYLAAEGFPSTVPTS